MGYNSRETYQVAEDIYNKRHDETGFRSSTNRAYYGAYIECCDLASRKSYLPNIKRNVHKGLYGQFGHKFLGEKLANDSDRRVKSVGRLLRQLYTLRCKADYDGASNYSYNQSKDALLKANKIINEASKL